MLLKLFFKQLSLTRQANFMKRRGIILGTRTRNGRQIYLYMVENLFAEITYENDNPQNMVESLVMINGLKQLNKHLEKDIRPNVLV